MKFQDLKRLFSKTQLEILDIENPFDDYYLIKLKNNDKVKWQAGEHAFFTLPGKKIKGRKWRTFSMASLENEGHMLIGIRTGKEISSLKKQLINMSKGEKVGVRGPFGGFDLTKKEEPLVLIASGVGVTPIRSILKELEVQDNGLVNVVYTSSKYHLFRAEIEALAAENKMINLALVDGKDATQKEIRGLVSEYGSKANYYISGSIPVVNSLKTLLKDLGIDKKRVINDPFYGYK